MITASNMTGIKKSNMTSAAKPIRIQPIFTRMESEKDDSADLFAC
jgi:hypothetical protein